MAETGRFDAIIIETDLGARMRLKQATASVPTFAKVYQVGGFREAITKMKCEEPCDVVFIASSFDQASIKSFIQDCKAMPQGQDSAYVMVVKSQDQSQDVVATNVLLGADGFLFEPYSVDSLVEITRLAAKLRKERSEAREEKAIRFILSSVSTRLDGMAYLKSLGREVSRHFGKLRELTSILRGLSPNSQETYKNVAVEMFGSAAVPADRTQSAKYAGASSRIKKKAEESAIAEIEAQLEKDPDGPPL